MRAALIASVALALSTVVAHAEDMVATNADGIMCRDAKSLAAFTAHDGAVKPTVMANPFSAIAKRFMTNCKDSGALTVHVIAMRKNTSIVTYNGGTWYVPNIDFFIPPPNCLKDGEHVTMTGKVESAFAPTDETNAKIGYHYPRLTLDRPVCFLGNEGEPAGRYVSLVGTSNAGSEPYIRLIGQHVQVTGVLTTPDNAHQPPDNMIMFDPVVK